MSKQIINTSAAPAAIGPYAQGIQANGFVFASGQLPIDPATGEFAGSGIKEQTRQSIENLSAILKEAGSSLDNVVKTTVFLQDMAHFADMNEVYTEYFGKNPPARSAFQVACLPKNALVEIEAIAICE